MPRPRARTRAAEALGVRRACPRPHGASPRAGAARSAGLPRSGPTPARTRSTCRPAAPGARRRTAAGTPTPVSRSPRSLLRHLFPVLEHDDRAPVDLAAEPLAGLDPLGKRVDALDLGIAVADVIAAAAHQLGMLGLGLRAHSSSLHFARRTARSRK